MRSVSAPAAVVEGLDLDDSSLYINRELSWLDFNDRVLQLAEDETLPLIERVKFLAIFVTNLDEFFMVRVAGVHDQLDARIDARGADGMAPYEVLDAIAAQVRELDRRHSRQWSDNIRPALGREGIRITTCEESGAPASVIERHFREQIFPVLTPLAVGPGRPFPYISNLSLSLIVRLHDPDLDHEAFARVKVPKEVLPRFVEISKDTFIPLEDIIARHLDALFPGMDILSWDLFRVTRDADFEVSDEADDLLQAVEDELRRRRFGEVVRLEVGAGMDPALRVAADRMAGRRRGAGLRRRGAARHGRPVADRLDRRPLRPAPAGLDAGRSDRARRRQQRGRRRRPVPPRCAPPTCSSTTRTSRSRRASSGSSSRRSTTPTCSRSR